MKTIKTFAFLVFGLAIAIQAMSFCGFYVAKADTKLFNKSSQVILARQGNKTVVTMSNDFQGDVTDFAMVVPVPEVLKEKNIRVVDQWIFDKLDAYSGPRLVEYYDNNPCQVYSDLLMVKSAATSVKEELMMEDAAPVEMKQYGVSIEAQYSIEEYDIVILSATESSGLEEWLLDNGYKIPKGAEEVLEPYIKSDLKFFVVKVNMEEFNKTGYQTLRPIQITYESSEFMLPIRLGMANANGDQDLIIYALTTNGRVETTNYRTLKIPTDKNIPTFIEPRFGEFYRDVFNKNWRKNKKAVYLEYAWDVSATNPVKCDPCVGPPPINNDLVQAGAWWIQDRSYSTAFLTRLHVRYNRENFPQDLLFQTTPNTERFQGRYVMTHPAPGPFDCEDAQDYLIKLVMRMKEEVNQLTTLTGSQSGNYTYYWKDYEKLITKPQIEYVPNDDQGFLTPDESGKVANQIVDSIFDVTADVLSEDRPSVEYVAPEEREEGKAALAGLGDFSPYLLVLVIVGMGIFYVFSAFKKKAES